MSESSIPQDLVSRSQFAARASNTKIAGRVCGGAQPPMDRRVWERGASMAHGNSTLAAKY